MEILQVRIGDKVRLKRPDGARGIVSGIEGSRIAVRIAESDRILTARPEDLTNFSLAARKAWRNMPTRKVGRPKGSRVCDRLSVTIRLDRDLWESFRRAEAQGVIDDRTSSLNRWIAEGLSRASAEARKAS